MRYKGLILFFIIVIALVLRLYDINWDQNQHLHPDERFLTMVGMAEKIPNNILNYLDPVKSSLNPYNTNFKFFVYGSFPLTLTKIVAVLVNFDSYHGLTLIGRFLSTFFDVGTLIFVYLIVLEWIKRYALDKKLALVSAFFYAIAVLPIQHAHFFVNDGFLVFFLTGSLYFILRFFYDEKIIFLLLSSIFFGFGLTTKISALYSLPLILSFVFLSKSFFKKPFSTFKKSFIFTILFLSFGYIALRIGDPKFFSTGNFFNLHLNDLFVNNLKQLEAFNNDKSWFPPGVQWIGKTPIIFALINIAFFGLGIPYFLLAIFGIYVLGRKKKREFVFVTAWVGLFFIYQSSQYVKTTRYFLVLYPLFSIFAAFGYVAVIKLARHPIRPFLSLLLLILTLVWPISFLHIYTKPHSRVEASFWMYQNIPEGAFLAEEHWDDSLPLPLSTIPNKQYQSEQMPVFDPDTPEKWQKMEMILSKADYYVITSSRAYKHIVNLPSHYPKMSQFYKDLFNGKLQFKKIKEFTSYPTLCFMSACLEFPDQWADEGFTVFDHPKVTIFKKI